MDNCKDCNCNCHCNVKGHSDLYGVCPCENCKCKCDGDCKECECKKERAEDETYEWWKKI